MAKIIKRIYFVRHGQTDGNVKNIYQDGFVPLSETGKKQAAFVGERFKNIPASAIVASDYVRTKETAAAIAQATGLPVVSSELFREIKRPDDILGMEKNEPYAKKVMDEMLAHESEPDWRHGNEENLFDAVARARKALEYLIATPNDKIIVVTHELFMKTMMCAMAKEDDAGAVRLLQDIRFFMIGENTGITIAEYGDFGFSEKFKLRIWNDHAHL